CRERRGQEVGVCGLMASGRVSALIHAFPVHRMCAWRPSLPDESGLKTRSRARPALGAVRGTRTRRALFLCPVVRERMPKRTDIKSILIIGAGPIVIGQACEFDYSGTQACKALKEEGYRIVLVNSNPATIMTDPDLAD